MSGDVHGGDVWAAARELGVDPGEIMDFSASINPLGPPPSAIEAAKGALETTPRYPEPTPSALIGEYARRCGVTPENVLAGNGSVELIYLVARAAAPSKALVIEPAFSEYRRSLVAAGWDVEELVLTEEEGFTPSAETVAGRLEGAGDMGLVYLCNPANPTGAAVDGGEVLRIARACSRAGVLLVVDEAFADFREEVSVKGAVEEQANLVVLRSMTKFYALAGLRLGFCLSGREVTERLRPMLPPWTVNTPAAAAGLAALRDRDYAGRTLELISAEKTRLADGLRGLGLTAYPSSANFLMAALPPGASAPALAGELRKSGVLLRDLSRFRGLGEGFIRVAVRTREENNALISALAGALKPEKAL